MIVVVHNGLTGEGIIIYHHITTCKITSMLFSCWFTAYHIFRDCMCQSAFGLDPLVAWEKLTKLFPHLPQFHTGCINQGWNMNMLSYAGRNRGPPKTQLCFAPGIRMAAGHTFHIVCCTSTVDTRLSIATCEHLRTLPCCSACSAASLSDGFCHGRKDSGVWLRRVS